MICCVQLNEGSNDEGTNDNIDHDEDENKSSVGVSTKKRKKKKKNKDVKTNGESVKLIVSVCIQYYRCFLMIYLYFLLCEDVLLSTLFQ